MDKLTNVFLLACGLAAAGCAHAEATQVSPNGFLLVYRAEVDATPARVFEAIGQVDRWWNASHSYSGNAANLVLEMRAGGCFCERWADGSVEHARVIYVARDKALRLEGAFGPLQPMAVAAILTFAIGVEEGKTRLSMTYRVRGVDAGLDKVAAPVDQVFADQFKRLTAYAAAR